MNFSKCSSPSTFSLMSLGCSKNQVDSEIIADKLLEKGLKLVGPSEIPDIIIINTCGFIEDAKEESICHILETARDFANTRTILIVAGCLSQLYNNQLKSEIPEIDILMGTNEYPFIYDIISKYIKTKKDVFIENIPIDLSSHHKRKPLNSGSISSYIKIAEGCSKNCSYCIIPLIKGKYRSKPMSIIIDEIKMMLSHKILEINIISQDTLFYGKDQNSSMTIIDLIKEIDSLKEKACYRLLYLNPSDISEALLKTIRDSERFINYIDIPVQHFSDRILRAMNRHQTQKLIYDKIELIRKILPDPVIRTTVMVGFPGERDEDFEQLLDGIMNVRFDRLGCFIYSDEEPAKSSAMKNKVERHIALERQESLIEIQYDIHQQKMAEKIGTTQLALISPYENRLVIQAPEVDGELILDKETNKPSGLYNVLITNAEDYNFIGRIADT